MPNLSIQPQRISYINGIGLSYAGVATVNIAVGQCSNSTDVNDMILEEVLTPSLLSSGALGLDTGAVAASTFYAVYLIGDSQKFNTPSAVFSADLASPLMPSGYDMSRRIGYVLTDGSSNIRPFIQTGNDLCRKVWYQTAVAELSAGTSATYANIDLASSVPASVSGLEVFLLTSVTPTASGDSAQFLTGGVTATVGTAVNTGFEAAKVNILVVSLPCSAASVVQYKVTGSVDVATLGYIDQL